MLTSAPLDCPRAAGVARCRTPTGPLRSGSVSGSGRDTTTMIPEKKPKIKENNTYTPSRYRSTLIDHENATRHARHTAPVPVNSMFYISL